MKVKVKKGVMYLLDMGMSNTQDIASEVPRTIRVDMSKIVDPDALFGDLIYRYTRHTPEYLYVLAHAFGDSEGVHDAVAVGIARHDEEFLSAAVDAELMDHWMVDEKEVYRDENGDEFDGHGSSVTRLGSASEPFTIEEGDLLMGRIKLPRTLTDEEIERVDWLMSVAALAIMFKEEVHEAQEG